MVISQYNDSFVISGVKIIVALIHKLRNIFLSLVIGRGTQDASKTNPFVRKHMFCYVSNYPSHSPPPPSPSTN